MLFAHKLKLVLRLFVLVTGGFFYQTVSAKPLLRCEVTYAGTTHVVEGQINNNPTSEAGGAYTAEGINIADRFRFKTVLLGQNDKLEIIKIYVYYETHRQPVLVQEVKYQAPFVLSTTPYELTGMNFLYSPPLGRELQYGCALLETK